MTPTVKMSWRSNIYIYIDIFSYHDYNMCMISLKEYLCVFQVTIRLLVIVPYLTGEIYDPHCTVMQ